MSDATVWHWPRERCVATLLTVFLLFVQGCATRRPVEQFRVIPAQPDYLLRSPDLNDTPFEEVLRGYTEVGPTWVELMPQMQLRIEVAYFREGALTRDIRSYLGTEMARYQITLDRKLRLLPATTRLADRPQSQPPVDGLIKPLHSRTRYHRLFFQIGFDKRGGERTAALLSAPSRQRLRDLTGQLLREPDSICGGKSPDCTVFPQYCTVSLEMEVFVNGSPRTVLWGTRLANVAPRGQHIEVLRRYNGRLVSIVFDSADSNALRLPLLPGDHVNWS